MQLEKFVVIKGTYHKVQMFKVQNFKGKGVQCSNLNVQRIKIISVISEIRSWYYFAIIIRKTLVILLKDNIQQLL